MYFRSSCSCCDAAWRERGGGEEDERKERERKRERERERQRGGGGRDAGREGERFRYTQKSIHYTKTCMCYRVSFLTHKQPHTHTTHTHNTHANTHTHTHHPTHTHTTRKHIPADHPLFAHKPLTLNHKSSICAES
jgi:hypothetical protein